MLHPRLAGPLLARIGAYGCIVGVPSFMLAVPSLARAQCEAPLVDASLTSYAHLGRSVSLAGSRAFVGAPDDGQGDVGAVLVFLESAQGWVVEQRLQSILPMSVEGFGSAVHVVGDEAWIGAVRGSFGGNRRGYVDRFERALGTWSQVERIGCPDPQSGSFFGHALVRDGERLVVGAPQVLTGISGQRGKAYVFERVAGVWSLTDHVLPPPVVNIQGFGAALALEGDLLVVGAPSSGSSLPGQNRRPGAAFVYQHGPGGWQLVDEVFGTPSSEEAVGSAVAVRTIGGTPVVAIGAPFMALDSGAVLLRAPFLGAWGALGAPLTPPATLTTPHAGQALVFDGERLVAGAPELRSGAFSSGEGGAVLFTPAVPGDPSTYTFSGVLVSAMGVGTDYLGGSAASDGGRVILGAPQTFVGAASVGRAVVFGTPAAPRVVCQGLVNVSGVRATLAFGGVPSVSLNHAWIDVSGLPSPTFCLGIYGQSAAPFPLGGGILCLDLAPPGLTRFTPAVAVGASGTARLELDFPTLPFASAIMGNSTWTFQCWYRDANPFGSNLSDALEVSFCP